MELPPVNQIPPPPPSPVQAQAYVPQQAQGYPQQRNGAPPTTGVPGRPSGDPEKQELKREQIEERRRAEGLLPKQSTDGRVAIFRLKGAHGNIKTTPRPQIIVLFSELEGWKASTGNEDTTEFLTERIKAKFNTGRFRCEPQNKRGQILSDFGITEVNLDTEDTEVDPDETEPEAPVAAAPVPPPPPPMTANAIAGVKSVLEGQHRQSNEMVTVLMTLMSNQQQQAQQFAQAQLAADERRREDERRRDDARKAEEREERKREEDRAERRREMEEKREEARMLREREDRQTQQQLFMKLMEPKEDKTMPILFKMLEGKNDRDGMKEVMSMMSEANRESMKLNSEAARQAMQTQGEAAKTMITGVMTMSQQIMEAGMEAQQADPEDPMDKMAKFGKMVMPLLQNLGANQQAAQQTMQPAPTVPVTPPVSGQPAAAAAAEPTRANRPDIPDEKWIRGGLYAVMHLEEGKQAPERRFHILQWCAANFPPAMQQAIAKRDREEIMGEAQAVVLSDPALLAWIQDETRLAFLEAAVEDMAKMLTSGMTQEQAQASYKTQTEYFDRKARAAGTVPVAASAAPMATEEPRKPGQTGKRPPPPVTPEQVAAAKVAEEEHPMGKPAEPEPEKKVEQAAPTAETLSMRKNGAV